MDHLELEIMQLANFTQYVNDSYYQNFTTLEINPNTVAVIGWNGDQLFFYTLTLLIILQTISTMCLLYLVVRARRRENPGRED